jgi:hypothetical protein
MFDMQRLQNGIPEKAELTAQKNRKRLSAFRYLVLGMFLFSGSLDVAAQDVIVAGSEPGKNIIKKNPPAPKPVPARQDVYSDIRIVPDEDCIIIIDGVKQKDTLRAGKATSKKLVNGTHRLGAESVATGYVHNQQLKVDAFTQKLFVIPLKVKFEAHIKKVEAALSQQQ